MTADRDLAADVRDALSGAAAIREVKMFGGIGFMLNGNMVAAASRRGLLVRVGKQGHRDALAQPGARAMEMRGRTMEGYVHVDPQALTGGALETWLGKAVAFVQTLPAKAPGAKPTRTKGRAR